MIHLIVYEFFNFRKRWDVSKRVLYGGYHKIKYFACHRDFFLHEIPHIKHTQNASYPGIKYFIWLIIFSTNDWLWNVLYPGMKPFAYVLYVGFHAQRNLCDKQNALFYGTPPPYLHFLREKIFLTSKMFYSWDPRVPK